MLCGPFYHSAQWAFSFLPMIIGTATVMQHKYDSAGVLGLIDEYQATNIHLVPTQMKRMVDLPDDVKEIASTGRRCTSCCTVRLRVRRSSSRR